MPSSLATVFFVALIFVLLRRNSKCLPKHSWGLWVANIWIGIMISKPVSLWFQTDFGGDDVESFLEGNPIERGVLSFLICAGLFVLLRRRANWSAVFRSYPAFVWLFYAFAIVSIVWSPFPFVSFKRVIRELGAVVMILVILTETDPLDAVRRVFVRCAVVLVPLSVLFIKYYPLIGRYTHRWNYRTMYAGVTTNKNALGLLAMVSALFLLWHMVESKQGRTRWQQFVSVAPEAAVLGMCLWILSIADSQTAYVCFVLGVVVFIAWRTSFARLSVKATVATILIAGVCGGLVLTTPYLRGLVAGGVGRDESFTERTDIWAGALALPTNPAIGAGFASVWLTPAGFALKQQIGGLAHSHNGYLETYLDGGAVGVLLLFFVLFAAAVQAARHSSAKTSARAFYVALVFVGLVYNFTEVTFNNGNALGLLLWLIAMSTPGLAFRREGAQVDRSPVRSKGTAAGRTNPVRPRAVIPANWARRHSPYARRFNG